MGSHGVEQLVLRSRPIGRLVGEEDGGAAHSENAVAEEHGAVVAEVPIEGYVLHAEHQGVGVGVGFQKVFGQVNGDESRTASHAAKVVAFDVAPQLVVVHNHGGERRGGVEQTAIHHQNVNVLRLHAGFREKRVQRAEHHRFRLQTRLAHAEIWRPGSDSSGEVSLVAETRSCRNLPLELKRLFLETPTLFGHLQEGLHRDFPLLLRLVAREVHQIHRARALPAAESGEGKERSGSHRHGLGVELVGAEPGEFETGEGEAERKGDGQHHNAGCVA